MGIRLNKTDVHRRDMLCPGEFQDLTEAGSVYLVIHKPKKDGEKYTIEKKQHFGLAIDITGSSTATDFIATHYDLYVISSTDYTTYVDSEYKTRKWDHYLLVRKVGHIPLSNIQAFRQPNRYAKEVEHQLISGVHDPMCVINNGDRWSAKINCQHFTRCCIEYFGFEFPQDIKVISDCVPTMFNLDLSGALLTNKAIQKSNETLAT